MKSLGVTLGNALHLSPEASLSLGVWFARITGLSMFLAYTGAFFTLCYSPLKAIIPGGRRKRCEYGTDDAPECDGDAVYRHVDAVRVGYCLHPAGFVWWRYRIGVL
ncbi:hypothetical protein HTS61_01885 [Escherichia coli]|nr:hypothetical protein [Escherichia coli]